MRRVKKLFYPFPIFTREKLPLNHFGQSRSAFHIGPIGIFKTKDTSDSVLEQEKMESWIIFCMALPTVASIVYGIWGSWSWFMFLSLLPAFIYPLPFFIPYPFSIGLKLRRYFEIRTHAREGRYHATFAGVSGLSYEANYERWARSNSRTMERSKFYNLEMTRDEIYRQLMRHSWSEDMPQFYPHVFN